MPESENWSAARTMNVFSSFFLFSFFNKNLSWEKLKKQRNCAKRICESCQTSLS